MYESNLHQTVRSFFAGSGYAGNVVLFTVLEKGGFVENVGRNGNKMFHMVETKDADPAVSKYTFRRKQSL